MKQNKCKKCPYYEQTTSYGTELVSCMNNECEYCVHEIDKAHEYERGIDNAWSCARVIIKMPQKDRKECFGDLNIQEYEEIMSRLNYSEAAKKISTYYDEKKKQLEDKEIKIGDEIYHDDFRGFVVDIRDDMATVLWVYHQGRVFYAPCTWTLSDIKEKEMRTGINIPQIAGAFTLMKKEAFGLER